MSEIFTYKNPIYKSQLSFFHILLDIFITFNLTTSHRLPVLKTIEVFTFITFFRDFSLKNLKKTKLYSIHYCLLLL